MNIREDFNVLLDNLIMLSSIGFKHNYIPVTISLCDIEKRNRILFNYIVHVLDKTEGIKPVKFIDWINENIITVGDKPIDYGKWSK